MDRATKLLTAELISLGFATIISVLIIEKNASINKQQIAAQNSLQTKLLNNDLAGIHGTLMQEDGILCFRPDGKKKVSCTGTTLEIAK